MWLRPGCRIRDKIMPTVDPCPATINYPAKIGDPYQNGPLRIHHEGCNPALGFVMYDGKGNGGVNPKIPEIYVEPLKQVSVVKVISM